MKTGTIVVLGLVGATGIYLVVRHFMNKAMTPVPAIPIKSTPIQSEEATGNSIQIQPSPSTLNSVDARATTLNFDSEMLNFNLEKHLKGFVNASGIGGFLNKRKINSPIIQGETTYRCEWTDPRSGAITVYNQPCTSAQANQGWVTKAN